MAVSDLLYFWVYLFYPILYFQSVLSNRVYIFRVSFANNLMFLVMHIIKSQIMLLIQNFCFVSVLLGRHLRLATISYCSTFHGATATPVPPPFSLMSYLPHPPERWPLFGGCETFQCCTLVGLLSLERMKSFT